MRDSFSEVVLVGRSREAIRRLNPTIPVEAREEALRVGTPSLAQTNRAFHQMLRDGVREEFDGFQMVASIVKEGFRPYFHALSLPWADSW